MSKSEVELFMTEIAEFEAEANENKRIAEPVSKRTTSEQNAYALETLSSGYHTMANILVGSGTTTHQAEIGEYALIGDVLSLTASAIHNGTLNEIVNKLKEN